MGSRFVGVLVSRCETDQFGGDLAGACSIATPYAVANLVDDAVQQRKDKLKNGWLIIG